MHIVIKITLKWNTWGQKVSKYSNVNMEILFLKELWNS